MPERRPETRSPWRLWLLPALLATLLSGCASVAPRSDGTTTTTGFEVRGRVALAEADILLCQRRADGSTVPRAEWTTAARLLYAQAAHEALDRQAIAVADHALAIDAGDIGSAALHERLAGVATAAHGAAGAPDAAVPGAGMARILRASGADYGLFTRLRGRHASDGRAAMRAAGRLLLGGDIGGDALDGTVLLVELRSGRVVWRRQLSGAKDDLRTLAGARSAVAGLLAGLHGPEPTRGQ